MPNPLPAIGRTLGNVGKYGGEWLMNLADPQRQQFQRQMQLQRERDFLDQQNWQSRQSVLHRNALEMLEKGQNRGMSEYEESMQNIAQDRLGLEKTRFMHGASQDMMKMLGYGGGQGMNAFQEATQKRWEQQDERQAKRDEGADLYKQLAIAGDYLGKLQPTRKFNPYEGAFVEGPSQIPSTPEQEWNARQNYNRLNAAIGGQPYEMQPYVSPTDEVIAGLQDPTALAYIREKLSTEEGKAQLKANGIDVGRLALEMGKYPAPAPQPLPERKPSPTMIGIGEGLRANSKLPWWGQPPAAFGVF